MADRTAISFAFTPAAGGDSESRWVRIEQVEPEGEMATMADAARFIDSLFDVDPCQKGEMGVGGQAVPTDEQGEPQDIPEEDTFVARAQQALDLSFCNPGDTWAAEVDVLRSHQSPGYVLKSDSCRIGPATVVQKTVSESFELDGASSIDLRLPYLWGLQISGSPVAAEVRGSTVNFAAPVSGSLLVQYQTVFDRVRIDVPRKADSAGNGQAEAEAASVLVFWSDFAAACDLQPPPADDSLDTAEIARLCRKPEVGYGLGGEKKCFETVEHYSLCNCSRRRVNPRREVVAAACPDGVPPGTHYLGTRNVLDGYVWCEGEEDEVSDPEYYKEKCCTPPPGPLPRCRKTFSSWRGGAGIEGGAAAWTKIYGSGVRLIPISPPDGICGEQVVEWNVDSKNCCEEIEPLKPHPNNPTTISPGSAVWLQVEDGKPVPLKWTASGGLLFRNGQSVLHEGGRREQVFAPVDICPNSTITVDDTCYPLQMQLHAPDAPPLRIPPGDRVVAPGGTITISAIGGIQPYQWASDQLELLASSGDSAMFQAPANFCGSATVTVSDACTQAADCGVRSTKGRWRWAAGYSQVRCELTFSGEFTQTAYNSGILQGDGYRIWVSIGHTAPCTAPPRCPGDNVLAAELSNQEYCQSHMGIQNQYYRSEYRGGGQCWSVPVGNPSGAGCMGTVHQYAYGLEEWVCA